MTTLSERDLQAVWYGGKAPSLTLRVLAAIYAALVALRLALYRSGVLRSRRLPVPVIVVGNLTVGGAGKTPLVIELVRALRTRGCRPGVVSRGYGGSVAVPTLLDDASMPAQCGDEPVLIRRMTGVPVAIARERVRGAQLLMDAGCDVLIADDGLQHYALARDIEICVIDGERRFGNERLLPAGPLREPLSRLAGFDFRICNGGEARLGEVAMRLVGDLAVPVAGSPAAANSAHENGAQPLAQFAGRRVHAVAGIGNPARFFSMLRGFGIVVEEHAFADHHAFVADDFAFGDDASVIMTQKDAVKCAAFARANWWQVPIRAVLPAGFLDEVVARLGQAETRATRA